MPVGYKSPIYRPELGSKKIEAEMSYDEERKCVDFKIIGTFYPEEKEIKIKILELLKMFDVQEFYFE